MYVSPGTPKLPFSWWIWGLKNSYGRLRCNLEGRGSLDGVGLVYLTFPKG